MIIPFTLNDTVPFIWGKSVELKGYDIMIVRFWNEHVAEEEITIWFEIEQETLLIENSLGKITLNSDWDHKEWEGKKLTFMLVSSAISDLSAVIKKF